MVEFLLRGFRRPSELAIASLGKLERDTLDVVWRRSSEVSVRDVLGEMEDDPAYTTVMTTLDRLHKKGLLSRRREGRAYVYRARYTLEELERGMTVDVIESLLGRRGADIEPLLSCIVDAVSERDRSLLPELERLVREKRRQVKRRGPSQDEGGKP